MLTSRPSGLPRVAASRVPLLACPKRYHQTYALNMAPQEPFHPKMAFGSAIHKALKNIYDPRQVIAPADRDLAAIVRSEFRAYPYPSLEDRLAAGDRALTTIAGYVASDADAASVIGVEVFGGFEVHQDLKNPLAFSSVFDALIARPENPEVLVVRDYKTGKREVDMDGAAVILAVAMREREKIGKLHRREFATAVLEYDFLGDTGLAERIVIEVGDVKPVWRSVSAKAQSIYGADDFPARPGEICATCPFRAECQPDAAINGEDLADLLG